LFDTFFQSFFFSRSANIPFILFIQYFFSLRRLANSMWRIKDHAVRESLRFLWRILMRGGGEPETRFVSPPCCVSPSGAPSGKSQGAPPFSWNIH
jgi:hypothetical protein